MLCDPGKTMADVFISYSRRDKEFVQSLHQALKDIESDVWVDWDNIPKGSEWWQEIQRGIEAAHTFVFIISPDSVLSEVCNKEVQYAVQCKKRLLPIVHRDNFNLEKLHPALSSHDWLFLRQSDNFDAAFNELIEAINTDLPFVKSHTRLLVKALEWESHERNDSFLLRGDDLSTSEDWLLQAETKEPSPTEQHKNYIRKSREAEDATQRANQMLKEAAEKANRRIRQGSVILGLMLLTTVGAGLFATNTIQSARLTQALADVRLRGTVAKQQLADGDGLTALVEGLQASNLLQTLMLNHSSPEQGLKKAQLETISVLNEVLYGSRESNRWEDAAAVWSIDVSPDGQMLVSGNEDGSVKLWAIDGNELKVIGRHRDKVTSVQFSTDGKKIVSGSSDGTVKIWSVSGQELKSFVGQSGEAVFSVSFSPDGEMIASGGSDGKVNLWNKNGQNLKTLPGNQRTVLSLCFSKDGKHLVAGGDDGTVNVWRISDNRLRVLLRGNEIITSVSFSPFDGDKNLVLVGGSKGNLKLIDATNQQVEQSYTGHGSPITDVGFSADGQTIVSTGEDGTIKLWRKEFEQDPFLVLQGHRGDIRGARFTPDAKILVSGSKDRTIRVWKMFERGQSVLAKEGAKVLSLAFAPNSETIAIGKDNGEITIENLGQDQNSNPSQITFESLFTKILSLSMSPDGQMLASGDGNGQITLWDLKGHRKLQFQGHDGQVWSLSFSPDGKRILSGGSDQVLKLWAIDGRLDRKLGSHEGSIQSVAFSSDGKAALSGSSDGAMKLWDVDRHILTRTIPGHRGSVQGVAFSPDRKTIASVGDDQSVRIWDLNGQLLHLLTGHRDSVDSVHFHPDGQTLVTGSRDGTLRIWSVNGRELGALRMNENVTATGFSPNGLRLAFGGATGGLGILDWNLKGLIQSGCDRARNYLTSSSAFSKNDLDFGNRQICQGSFTAE